MHWARGMTPEDVTAFNIYDNKDKVAVAQATLDRVEDPRITTPRRSIECRRLVQD